MIVFPCSISSALGFTLDAGSICVVFLTVKGWGFSGLFSTFEAFSVFLVRDFTTRTFAGSTASGFILHPSTFGILFSLSTEVDSLIEFRTCGIHAEGDLGINGTLIDLRAGDGNRTPEDAAFLLLLLNGEETDRRGIEENLEHVETVSLFSFPDIIMYKEYVAQTTTFIKQQQKQISSADFLNFESTVKTC